MKSVEVNDILFYNRLSKYMRFQDKNNSCI